MTLEMTLMSHVTLMTHINITPCIYNCIPSYVGRQNNKTEEWPNHKNETFTGTLPLKHFLGYQDRYNHSIGL